MARYLCFRRVGLDSREPRVSWMRGLDNDVRMVWEVHEDGTMMDGTVL